MREKLMVVQRLRGECTTHTLTKVSVRDVGLIIDEPAERGGTNQGPAPTETLLAALIGCTNVIGHKCAAKHGVRLHTFEVEVEGTFDRRGVVLQEAITVPFVSVRVVIRASTDAGAADMDKVRDDLRRFCPVSQILRQAGTVVEDVWEIDYR